jgi:hypothetical protein
MLASFVVITAARVVISESRMDAIVLGLIIELIAPAAESAKRHRKTVTKDSGAGSRSMQACPWKSTGASGCSMSSVWWTSPQAAAVCGVYGSIRTVTK